LLGLFEPNDLAIISVTPASSRTGLAAPPAISPVPSLAGFNNILLELYLYSISWFIVVPFRLTLTNDLNASSSAFLIASGTSLALPTPKPTVPFLSIQDLQLFLLYQH
jgi:hypothetical protein